MNDKPDIVFIGMAIMDVIIKGFDPEPVSVTGYRAESAALNYGGEAVNGSIASSKLGMKPSILCHLGRDIAGDIIVGELEKKGVDTSKIVRSDDHATPVTTIFGSEDGNRKSITNSAHRYNFHPEQYLNVLEGAKALVLGSLFRAPFDDPKVVREIAEFARSQDMLLFADTKLPNFAKVCLDDFADSLPLIDYITPNEDEARFCTGEDEPDKMADVFLEKGARAVIIKLGGKGCYFKSREKVIYLPAYEIPVKDATGAGDNFLAGLSSELIRGSSIEDALKFAGACGAICTTAVGSGTALKSREQVLDLVKEQKVKQHNQTNV